MIGWLHRAGDPCPNWNFNMLLDYQNDYQGYKLKWHFMSFMAKMSVFLLLLPCIIIAKLHFRVSLESYFVTTLRLCKRCLIFECLYWK